MTDRSALIATFLANAGWSEARAKPLAGDASNRRYERLTLGSNRAVLMDAPPDKGEDVRPFIQIADHLIAAGLSAPQIFAKDIKNGLLLIEDLGDDLFSRVVADDPTLELPLYLAATDALIALHKADLPQNVPDYGVKTMCDMVELASDWYLFGATGEKDEASKTALHTTMRDALNTLEPWNPVLVLRDYHAENLLWLPDRQSPANVGQLDFQDAALGHPAYDLMSLARDVRRTVSPDTRDAIIKHYANQMSLDLEAFERSCATVSAQRNLRILGVFARLSMHFGKPHYVDLLPVTWSNLWDDLTHPGLASLADTVKTTLPPPTPDLLQRLKDKCATVPTLS